MYFDMRKVMYSDKGKSNYVNEGKFHQWGTRWDGDCQATCAIIERLDGIVELIDPWEVKFIN